MGMSNPRPGSIWSSPLMKKNVDDYSRSMGGIVKWAPRLATAAVGGLAGAAVAPALLGGSVAGGTASSGYSSPGVFSGIFGGGAPSVVAPTVAGAGGSTLGSILNSDALGLGVGAVTNWLGNRSQNKANRYVADLNAKNTAETLALERSRLEQEMQNANLDRADAMKLQEAVNELKRRELDALEEDRAYNRSLIEAREMRAAPRREMSARAMRSLGAILGF